MTFPTTVDKTKCKKMIQEIVDSMARSQGEAELVSEICKQAKDELGIAPADLKKIAKIRFERNFEEAQQKVLEPFEKYEELYTNTATA